MDTRGMEEKSEMMPPFVVVGRRQEEWANISASPWLVRQLRFGIHISWIRKPKRTMRVPDYKLEPTEASFVKKNVERWLVHELCRREVGKKIQYIRKILPAFVTVSSGKPQIVIE